MPGKSLTSLFGSAAGLAAMRIGGAGVGFLTQILLARVLGAHDLGIFYSATSLATAAGYVTTLGYSQVAARFAGRYREPGRERLFVAFVSRAALDGMAVGCVTALLVAALSFLVPGLEPKARVCFAVAGIGILASTALVVFTNVAGAIRMFGWCYVPEGIARPAAFLVGVLLLAAIAPLSAIEVTILYAVLNGLCAVAVVGFMVRTLPRLQWPKASARHVTGRWRREAGALVLLSLYINAFSDIGILFATPFLTPTGVALFGICLKLSLLIGYIIQVAQQLVVPDLADARRIGDRDAMRRTVRRSLPLPIALTLGAMLGCELVGDRVLAVFGPQFAEGRPILVVLVAVQVVRALAGPSAHLVTLSGAQRLNAGLCVGALVLLAVANAVLAPRFGAVGAAAAVFISYTGWLLGTGIGLSRLGEIRTDLFASFGRADRPADAARA